MVTMSSRQRMLTALQGNTPDRLPVTVHQWQRYHLTRYMNGMDSVAAFKACQLDASITPTDIYLQLESDRWLQTIVPFRGRQGENLKRVEIVTPGGALTAVEAATEYTVFKVEHLIKTVRDAELFLEYWPGIKLDRDRLDQWARSTGDGGIVRGLIPCGQPGPWQCLCSLMGTEQAILFAIDEPAQTHGILERLTARKIELLKRHFKGAPFDLIEHGGGAGSANVISPMMFETFCTPYDRQITDVLHEIGFLVTYHTCGHMMPILDRIARNGCDASETLSPRPVGGDIDPDDRAVVKSILGSEMSLIGGLDQSQLLKSGTKHQIESEVRNLFDTFGRDGGYICSACDHFFDVPVEQLRLFASAAHQCVY